MKIDRSTTSGTERLGAWLIHAFRWDRQGISRKGFWVLLTLLLVVWLVSAAYLVLVGQTTVVALRIQNLREELAYWQEENEALLQKIAERQAVVSLWQQAQERGFVFPERIEFVEP